MGAVGRYGNDTCKSWNMCNYLSRNCAGEAYRWLEQGGIYDNWPSWLPFAHPDLW